MKGDSTKKTLEQLQAEAVSALYEVLPVVIDAMKAFVDGRTPGVTEKQRAQALKALRRHGWDYVNGQWVQEHA